MTAVRPAASGVTTRALDSRRAPGREATRPVAEVPSREAGHDGEYLCDVVVVGGGIHGCALAYELSRGGLEVTLLERDVIAAGASGGPGMRGVRANDRDARELPLMRRAYDLWPTLSERLGRPSGYKRTGGLELMDATTFADPAAMARIRAQVTLQDHQGIPSELVSGPDLAALEPGIDLDNVAAAVYCPLDGVADHTQATAAYAAAALEIGAQILEGVAVTSVNADGGRIGAAALTADGAVFRGRIATVLLVNSYTQPLLERSFGLHLPVWRWTPQVTMIQPPSGATVTRLIGHMTRPLSAKTLPDGTIMLSGGRSGTWDEVTDTGVVDDTVPDENLADMAHTFPSVLGATITSTDASRSDSSCVDDIPVIDRVPRAPSVFFAAGWSGHGFAIAPAVATLLAEWISTGKRSRELDPFSLARLSPSQPPPTAAATTTATPPPSLRPPRPTPRPCSSTSEN